MAVCLWAEMLNPVRNLDSGEAHFAVFLKRQAARRKFARQECAAVTCRAYQTYWPNQPDCATFPAPETAFFAPKNGLFGTARGAVLASNMAYIALQYGSFCDAI